MSFDPQNYYWKRGTIGPPKKSRRTHHADDVDMDDYRHVVRTMNKTRELKGVGVSISNADIPSTTNTRDNGSWANAVSPGDSDSQRVGRKIFLHSLRIRGSIQCTFEGTGTDVQGFMVRMVLVWDKQPQTVQDFDGLSTGAVTYGTIFGSVMGFVNLKRSGRFSVIRDRVFECRPPGAVRGSGDTVITEIPFDEYIPLNGRETIFSGSESYQIASGGLMLWWRSTLDSSKSHANVTNDVSRLRFTD